MSFLTLEATTLWHFACMNFVDESCLSVYLCVYLFVICLLCLLVCFFVSFIIQSCVVFSFMHLFFVINHYLIAAN